MEISEIITLFSSLILAILGSSVTTKVLDRFFQKRDKDNSERKVLKMLMFRQLEIDFAKISDAPSITKTQYDQFKEEYEAYKGTGGDGWADKMWEDVNNKSVFH